MLIKIKSAKKPVKGDVNYLAREKIGRPRDGMNKAKFDDNYDGIKWKSKEKEKPFPECTKGCYESEHWGVRSCPRVCPHRFDKNGNPKREI